MAVLAVSKTEEMAVVTGTLILWRSLGSVIGVAVSSLVVQNGLVRYLDYYVTGPDKYDVSHFLSYNRASLGERLVLIYRQQIIAEVRRSVHAIADLDPVHKEEVIEAYAASLQVTFSMTVVLAIIMTFIIIPIKLPRLGKRA